MQLTELPSSKLNTVITRWMVIIFSNY